MKNKFSNALSLALIVAMLFTSVALADNVKNDVVAGGNDTFTAGGSTTIDYWIQATGGNGCDASSSSPAIVTIGVPADVTASTSQLTFTDCNTSGNEGEPNNTQSVTFSSSTAGDYAISATATGYNDSPADFTLHVLEAPTASDTTPPTITINTPADGATYLLNQAVVADYFCEDEVGGSGLASCVGTVADGAAIDTSTVGSHSFTVDAADNAGNTNFASASYSVIYNFDGFFQPVDNILRNGANAGRTIPLKWRLTDANGAPVLDLTSVNVTVQSLACSLGTSVDQVEEYASGASGLQNLGDGYYQFNWQTPKSYASSCKTLSLNLGDGVAHTAEFQFKK